MRQYDALVMSLQRSNNILFCSISITAPPFSTPISTNTSVHNWVIACRNGVPCGFVPCIHQASCQRKGHDLGSITVYRHYFISIILIQGIARKCTTTLQVLMQSNDNARWMKTINSLSQSALAGKPMLDCWDCRGAGKRGLLQEYDAIQITYCCQQMAN